MDTCIALLQEYFHPDSSEDGYSLAIDEGADGSRLTHSHTLQYNYVLQSLTLWRNIIDDLFRLWYVSTAYTYIRLILVSSLPPTPPFLTPTQVPGRARPAVR